MNFQNILSRFDSLLLCLSSISDEHKLYREAIKCSNRCKRIKNLLSLVHKNDRRLKKLMKDELSEETLKRDFFNICLILLRDPIRFQKNPLIEKINEELKDHIDILQEHLIKIKHNTRYILYMDDSLSVGFMPYSFFQKRNKGNLHQLKIIEGDKAESLKEAYQFRVEMYVEKFDVTDKKGSVNDVLEHINRLQ